MSRKRKEVGYSVYFTEIRRRRHGEDEMNSTFDLLRLTCQCYIQMEIPAGGYIYGHESQERHLSWNFREMTILQYLGWPKILFSFFP